MRRPIIVGVALAAGLAVMPLVSHAATAPSVTLTSPTANQLGTGDLSINWSYSGLHRTVAVDVEVARGSGAFQRLARVAIDDGTPGNFGSYTWSTATVADGDDYTVRISVPTRTSTTSSVSPIRIDNGGPTTTIDDEPVTDPAPAAAVLTITGSAADAVAGVASVSVSVDGGEPVVATCAACGPGATSVDWTASATVVPPGEYEVTSVATDVLGHVGEPTSATLVVVGTPEDPTPALLQTVTTTTESAVELATTTTEDAVDTVTTTTEDAVEDATTTETAGSVIDTLTTTTEGVIEDLTTTSTVGETVDVVTTTTGDGS